MRKSFLIHILSAGCLLLVTSLHASENREISDSLLELLSLDQCIEIALEKNQQRRISELAVKIAQHQYEQAISSYWPKLMVRSMVSRLDENPVLILPEDTSVYRINGLTTPDLSIPGVGTIPGGTLPSQEATVIAPERSITLMDRDNMITSLEMTWPVYTGGERPAVIQQSKSNIEAARQASRRTDLQIIYDVKRMYYGVILSQKQYHTAADAMARLKATMDLTEQLYKEGAGSVQKTDYLKSKTMTESARAMVAEFKGNREISKAALINTMGLSWDADIRLSETDIPDRLWETNLSELIGNVYEFNPDWKQFRAAIEAARARIQQEKAGHLPKLMLTGTLWRMDNQYDYGLTNDQNNEGWKVGIGFQIPVFEGFLTSQKVKEAEAYSAKLEGQQILLKEGIALQVKHAFLLMDSYCHQAAATRAAMDSARENRSLHERAYEAALVETKDVIESQIMESIMEARYHHILFKHAEMQFLIEKLIGNIMQKQFHPDQDHS
jgi:outer membrane protein TolC